MSRIDVVPAEKNKFKVMVNFGGEACYTYSDAQLANKEAKKLHEQNPHYKLNLMELNG